MRATAASRSKRSTFRIHRISRLSHRRSSSREMSSGRVPSTNSLHAGTIGTTRGQGRGARVKGRGFGARVVVESTEISRPSTLDPRPSTLDPRPSTLDPRPSTLDPRPLRTLLAASIALLAPAIACGQALPYQNQSLPFETRVADLVGRM